MTKPRITNIADFRAWIEQRMQTCKQEAQKKELFPGRKASFETSAYELSLVHAALECLEQAEKNREAQLYAEDALERTGPLTDDQKQRNLELLEAYMRDAKIPDGAPSRDVLKALRICASLWEPRARIQGNLRADDIARACGDALIAFERLESIYAPEQNVGPVPPSVERESLCDAVIKAAEEVCVADAELKKTAGKRIPFEDQQRAFKAYDDALTKQQAALNALNAHDQKAIPTQDPEPIDPGRLTFGFLGLPFLRQRTIMGRLEFDGIDDALSDVEQNVRFFRWVRENDLMRRLWTEISREIANDTH